MNALYHLLCSNIANSHTKAAVAFSGGIDSTLLLKAARDSLGNSNVLAVTVSSPLVTAEEMELVYNLAAEIKVPLHLIKLDILQVENIAANNIDRCYFCKQHLFLSIIDVASQAGCCSVLEGSNVSDLDDFRPGSEAIARMEMVKSPLIECGLTKSHIRQLARYLNLPNWNKPAQSCLASRIPYGTRLTADNLTKVSDAEARIRKLGFMQVRVRYHGALARIEIAPQEFHLMLDPKILKRLAAEVKACGFTYAALDMDGYRAGSANEILHSGREVQDCEPDR
ncbi:MAG: ATP-dependent sacrificial sulfur transferase LarE [Syntrophomonadaceae bacterium]|nr:ATP-dependent sacrificial sulfur transferase LarE [Syntrophomonadaceae bacterium]